MNRTAKRVLDLLKSKKNKGVSFKDFTVGFRLAARVRELRQDGHNILTSREPKEAGGFYARYVLLPK